MAMMTSSLETPRNCCHGAPGNHFLSFADVGRGVRLRLGFLTDSILPFVEHLASHVDRPGDS